MHLPASPDDSPEKSSPEKIAWNEKWTRNYELAKSMLATAEELMKIGKLPCLDPSDPVLSDWWKILIPLLEKKFNTDKETLRKFAFYHPHIGSTGVSYESLPLFDMDGEKIEKYLLKINIRLKKALKDSIDTKLKL